MGGIIQKVKDINHVYGNGSLRCGEKQEITLLGFSYQFTKESIGLSEIF
jgi:hypothetical protein